MNKDLQEKIASKIRQVLLPLILIGLFFLFMIVMSVPIGIFFGFLLGFKIFACFAFLFVVTAFVYCHLKDAIEKRVNDRMSNQ